MNVIPTPVLQERPAAESPSTAGVVLFPKNEASGQASASSFSAVLKQANRPSSPPQKSSLSGKEQAKDGAPSLLPQEKAKSLAMISEEGTGTLQLDLAMVQIGPVVILEEASVPQEKVLPHPPAALKSEHVSIGGIALQNGLSPEPVVVDKEESVVVGTNRGASPQQFPSDGKPLLPGEIEAGVKPVLPNPNRVISSQIAPTPAPTPLLEQEALAPALARETGQPLSPGHRLSPPTIPASFMNETFIQERGVVNPAKIPNVSTIFPPPIQGGAPSAVGASSGSGNESVIHNHLSTGEVGEKGQPGSLLGHEHQGRQENGQTFPHKHQQPNHTPGASPLSPESGRDFRVNDSQTAIRPEGGSDRTRTLTNLSPQRLQMEVMLADETKVHVDVAVKQQQVSAQLMTDQTMLRNLAIQHEPHLDAQLSSVGLELKQFGAEVNEHGLFGQHLGDSSSQKPNGQEREEANKQDPARVPEGEGLEAEGRFHYVA